MITVRNLSVTLDRTPILHDVDATVPAGQMTALVGPNGAGKSTLLAAIGRLTAANAGTIEIGDKNISDFTPRNLALRLAIMRQDTHVAPRLTVRDLVGFGRYPHSHGRMTQQDHNIVDDIIARMELTEFADRFLDTLSGGQRQRALIAMTLAQDTDIVLLDEPLNNLDLVHARRVMKIAREEVAKGKTVVLVLHDLTVAGSYADHVIAMKNGTVAAQGPVDDVINEPVLTDLYDTPVQVIDANGHKIVVTI